MMEEHDYGAIMVDYSYSSRNSSFSCSSSSSSSPSYVEEEVSSNYASQSDEESCYFL